MTAALYVGETTHHRLGPAKHSFRYSLFQLLVDTDRLDEDLRGLKLLRRGRFGLFSLDDRDHGWRDGRPLRGWVETRLAEAGVTASARRIRLLAFPRVLGFVFNPISLIYVEDAAGSLEAVIYEVNSTFGQTHAYVAPAAGRGRQSQVAEKRLFVSPFYGVDGRYRFDITPPDDRLDLSIVKSTDGRPDFTATLALHRQPLDDRRLMGLFFGMPLMTVKILAAIHWEALRLFLKGIPVVARPPSPDVGVSRATLLSRVTGKNDDNLSGTEGCADDADKPDAHDPPADRRVAGLA
ncbi:MAG: DUF1365 domain-containing protein [Caulobacter sp.]|nr:DUF1365 domain-containing protein [Caulobacter sp.]